MMNWIVITISILLAIFGIYREVRRDNKARMVWRVTATILAIIALACLALPITYDTSRNTLGENNIILITKGFNEDSLKNCENDNAYTLDTNVSKSYPKAHLVGDITEIYTDSITTPNLHIFGYGLDQYQLSQLKGKPTIYHPSSIPNGVIAINWTGTVKTGTTMQVQGQIKSGNSPVQVILKGLNTTLDSVNITVGKAIPFSLSTTPKHLGKAVYRLIGLRQKDTLFNEELPVITQPTQPVKILMLSASPDFENKFLRTWLGNNGYGVAARSVVTKDKYGQEFVNTEKLELSHITPSVLNKFDVVEADLSAIKSLTPAESAALKQEVENKGLGLIVRADSGDKATSWVEHSFSLKHQNAQALTVSLNINGKGKTAKVNAPTERIISQNDIQPLVMDERDNILSANTISGSGHIIFSTISNSYSWVLAGNKDDYAALWSLLINKAARKAPASNNWALATDFPTVNEPVTIKHYTSSPVNAISINHTVVAPAQNPAIPFEWQMTYHPQNAGWQEALDGTGIPFAWFVWKKTGWTSLKATITNKATQQFAQTNNKLSSVTKQIQQKQTAEFPKIYFYILFLIAAAYLWAESKYPS